MPSASKTIGMFLAWCAFTACGEPAFENAGSQASLIEDREACATEINNSPAAEAYRRNPDGHPEYPTQVFNEMNRCIERKGWRLVQSEQDQEQLRAAVVKEAQKAPPTTMADSKAKESLARAVQQRFSLQNEVQKN
jgi:hypothetical protein